MYAISNSQYELIRDALQAYVAETSPTNLTEYNKVRRVRMLLRSLDRKQPFDKEELRKVEYGKR